MDRKPTSLQKGKQNMLGTLPQMQQEQTALAQIAVK